ncbi:hypothetical protein ASC66_16480 [Leifsonia sp. Root4]|uniref:hypothetical protein n=1 Tax=Leifsonia sp. Root4 TaxID=1736525 RepID=UPI0006F621EC|nr:hypothetical protein [Leifsonia sp. Root4]KQW04054.1 hypothetical protein ASC66_16480 [Leifsonia sp. Root4]
MLTRTLIAMWAGFAVALTSVSAPAWGTTERCAELSFADYTGDFPAGQDPDFITCSTGDDYVYVENNTDVAWRVYAPPGTSYETTIPDWTDESPVQELFRLGVAEIESNTVLVAPHSALAVKPVLYGWSFAPDVLLTVAYWRADVIAKSVEDAAGSVVLGFLRTTVLKLCTTAVYEASMLAEDASELLGTDDVLDLAKQGVSTVKGAQGVANSWKSCKEAWKNWRAEVKATSTATGLALPATTLEKSLARKKLNRVGNVTLGASDDAWRLARQLLSAVR